MIGTGMGLDPAIMAGAVISGSYFGDKISPLSDTTTLAAGVAKVNLFDHIKAMAKPTGVAAAIALVAFTILGLTSNGGAIDATRVNEIQDSIKELFVVSP